MDTTKAALSAAAIAVVAMAAAGARAGGYNAKGDVLIADQFNNRVIEIAPDGHIVWQFGRGPDVVDAASPIGVNDALRIGERTLISATGAPAGTEPKCPSGCADNRVLLVDENGEIVWQYGKFGVTGAGRDQLNIPVQATITPRHTILITDQANQRVIEVSFDKKILWQYGTTGVAGKGRDQLNNPNSAEVLDNNDVLIADQNNNRAIEVDRDGHIVAALTAHGTLNGVAFASRLPNGDTLITDSNNNRIVQLNYRDKLVWSYSTLAAGGNANPLPTRAIRLKNGDTIISDQFNHRVIVVDKTGATVAQYGNLNSPGYGKSNASQGLNAPYDAKVIGEDTGLTWSSALRGK